MSHDSIRGYVSPSVGPSVMLLSAGRDEPANDLFRVYELVNNFIGINTSKLRMSAPYRSFQELWKSPIFFENRLKIHGDKRFSTGLRVRCSN